MKTRLQQWFYLALALVLLGAAGAEMWQARRAAAESVVWSVDGRGRTTGTVVRGPGSTWDPALSDFELRDVLWEQTLTDTGAWYPCPLPPNSVSLALQARTAHDFKVSARADGEGYWTVKSGAAAPLPGSLRDGWLTGTVYLSSPTQAALVVEAWRRGPGFYHLVEATAVDTGTVEPDGRSWGLEGTDYPVTATAGEGRVIFQLLVDSVAQDTAVARSEYTHTFADIADNHELQATFALSPDVRTDTATSVDHYLATLNAELTRITFAQVHTRFRWREAGAAEWELTDLVQQDTELAFDAALTELEPETAHEFQAGAVRNDQYFWGDLRTFTTDPLLAVQTDAASLVDYESAQLNGEITALVEGETGEAAAWFQWREIGALLWEETDPDTGIATAGTFDAALTELDFDTEYEFRAVAETETIPLVRYGEIRTFTTDPVLVVASVAADTITDTSANLKANATTLEHDVTGDVSGYFLWREKGAAEWNSTADDPETLTEAGVFNKGISELDPETDYEFRAVAEAADITLTVYGDILEFETLAD